VLYSLHAATVSYGGQSPASVGWTCAQVELKGAPNWKACQLLAESVVNTSQATPCRMAPCALGKHQPPAHGRFYGLTGIFVLYNFLDLQHPLHLTNSWKRVINSVGLIGTMHK
jgi:hypothetical protein